MTTLLSTVLVLIVSLIAYLFKRNYELVSDKALKAATKEEVREILNDKIEPIQDDINKVDKKVDVLSQKVDQLCSILIENSIATLFKHKD